MQEIKKLCQEITIEVSEFDLNSSKIEQNLWGLMHSGIPFASSAIFNMSSSLAGMQAASEMTIELSATVYRTIEINEGMLIQLEGVPAK